MQVSCRILIVDDHEVVRKGVHAILLKSRPAWEVCGEAGDGKEAIQAAIALQPDVVLLDITMPVMNGLEAASRIASIRLPCRVLIFTMHESESLVADVRKTGACGCVQKSRAAHDLILAIETLMAGGTFFSSAAEAKPKGNDEPNPDVAFFKALRTT
jgi:two-component system nitrate/nitrite response regulator NarL